MNNKWNLSVLILMAAATLTQAQTEFRSGSDGSYGPIIIPFASGTVVLDVPDDGVFHATSITIESGAVLRFNPNRLNTPVHLLATEEVVIEGQISVAGQSASNQTPIGGAAGPGGYQGGAPGIQDSEPGDGHGPGGGKAGDPARDAAAEERAGSGAFGSIPSEENPGDGQVYGNPLLIPLVGGSGGGGGPGQPGLGGAGGGGALLIASDVSVTVRGTIDARGGTNNGFTNHGSGGAVRIVSPIVQGSGQINVTGGAWGEVAGRGRVRIDLIDRTNLSLRYEPVSSASIGSYMAVQPDVLPQLDIIHVAGQNIPVGTTEGVIVFLPFGSDPNQVVRVQGSDFTGEVPIKVVLVPDSGETLTYDAVLDMQTGNPATIEVPVVLPVNVTTYIYAWTD